MKKLRSGVLDFLSINRMVRLALGVLFFFNACYYDNEETLYPGGCITTGITYLSYVRPFIDANCTCHIKGSTDGNINMAGYCELKKLVDDGRFIKVIKHESGVVPMPPSVPKRSSCDIEKLESWVKAGALNN